MAHCITLNTNDPLFDGKLALIRSEVSKKNKTREYQECHGRDLMKSIYAVRVYYRLGKNNPNAHHYHRGGRHWRRSNIGIKREHAVRAEIYVSETNRFKYI